MLIAAWRLVVATCAATGVTLAAVQYDVWWTALSQLANLAVALSYAGLAAYSLSGRTEPRSPWLRGALATLMTLVALAYLPMQNGNITEPYSVFEHLVTPALVVADFLLVGRNQAQVRWWHPLTWLLAPLAYLGWYVASELRVYAPLDPGLQASFVAQLALLSSLVLLAGFAFYAVGRRRRTDLLVSTV
ncbi:MAG: hypothetical protein WKF79_13105 [Nocardioides sp.]